MFLPLVHFFNLLMNTYNYMVSKEKVSKWGVVENYCTEGSDRGV